MTKPSPYQTLLFQAGNAIGVRIPKTLCESLNLQVGDPIEMESKNGSLILTPTQLPRPDAIIVNAALEILENFYKGMLGRYNQTSEKSLNLETIKELDIKAYRAPLFSSKNHQMHHDILIPIDYMNDFKKLLSFLYDYFLLSNMENGFNQVVKSQRESLFNKWFHDSHASFYNQWDVDKSLYYKWMKGRVLNDSE